MAEPLDSHRPAGCFRSSNTIRRWRKLFVAVCLASVTVLGACGSDGDSGQGGPTTGDSFPPSSDDGRSTTPSLPDAGCTQDFRHRLEVFPDDFAELPYLDQVSACTDDAQTSTLLINESDAAWTIESVGGAEVTQLDEGVKITLFLAEIATVYEQAVLAPGTSVIVHDVPPEVSWHLAPGFAAVWVMHDAFYEEVQIYGQAQIEDLLVRGSLRRQAFLTCGKGIYDSVRNDLSGLQGDDPVQGLFSAIGIGENFSSCAQAWRTADEAAIERFGQTATWTDDVLILADSSAFRSHADDTLSLLKRFSSAVLKIR